jgi:hypothetical protein
MKEIRFILSLFAVACLAGLAQPVLIILGGSASRPVAAVSLLLAAAGLICLMLLFFKVMRFNKTKEPENPHILHNEAGVAGPTGKPETEVDCQPFVQRFINSASGSKDMKAFTDAFFKKLGKELGIMQAALYLKDRKQDSYRLFSGYALITGSVSESIAAGEGLSGQVAIDKKPLILSNLPPGYRVLDSGLGKGTPGYLYIIPVLQGNDCVAILELASFAKIHTSDKEIAELLMRELGSAFKKYPNLNS